MCIRDSLNAADPETYQQLCRPCYGSDAWHAVVQFVQACVNVGLDTRVSVVEWPGMDLAACERLAGRLGVPLRRRRLAGCFPPAI